MLGRRPLTPEGVALLRRHTEGGAEVVGGGRSLQDPDTTGAPPAAAGCLLPPPTTAEVTNLQNTVPFRLPLPAPLSVV